MARFIFTPDDDVSKKTLLNFVVLTKTVGLAKGIRDILYGVSTTYWTYLLYIDDGLIKPITREHMLVTPIDT